VLMLAVSVWIHFPFATVTVLLRPGLSFLSNNSTDGPRALLGPAAWDALAELGLTPDMDRAQYRRSRLRCVTSEHFRAGAGVSTSFLSPATKHELDNRGVRFVLQVAPSTLILNSEWVAPALDLIEKGGATAVPLAADDASGILVSTVRHRPQFRDDYHSEGVARRVASALRGGHHNVGALLRAENLDGVSFAAEQTAAFVDIFSGAGPTSTSAAQTLRCHPVWRVLSARSPLRVRRRLLERNLSAIAADSGPDGVCRPML